ncbi:MAG: DUF924 family protein [bacterium]|nr:DUF924 family protein [bacterium]
MGKVKEILAFWFGEDPEDPFQYQSRWWKKDPAFDQEIRKRFGDDLKRAVEGEFNSWMETAEGGLALVILLDQFSRNMFRDRPESFAQDKQALEIVLQLMEQGLDKELSPVQRWFLYMPMMHSEDPEIHKKSLATYEALWKSAPPQLVKSLKSAFDYAEKHAAIIFRFGRYPHRNAILGRKSTPEEKEFLTQPGSSF